MKVPVPALPAWVLYDGACGLCDRSVRWLLGRDRRAALRFARLEGPIGEEVRARHPRLPETDETLLLVVSPRGTDERVYCRSAAAVRAVASLGGWFGVVKLFLLVPPALRDALYAWVARNRRRWFGRLESCRVPSPDERWRFLDVV